MAPCLRPCTVPTRPDRPVVSSLSFQSNRCCLVPSLPSPVNSQPRPPPVRPRPRPRPLLRPPLPLPPGGCIKPYLSGPPGRPQDATLVRPLILLHAAAPCPPAGMDRYGSFPAAAGDGGGCLPLPIVAAEGALAVLDGAIATAAFVQLARIHRHNQLQGWTRQKIFHLMIGLSNIVFLVYFVSTIIATCQRWICWVHGCGFVLMASPQILLLASFLLLLSFWVDLCHQTNDEDEEDGRSQSHHEALLDRTKVKPGIRPVNIRQRCCPGIQLGSRQKFVILVLVLSFVVMFAFAILIWIGRGENPIDSSLLKRVYLDVFSVVVIVLGGALACYGAVLFSKMSKVRSETVSTEKWKVASLAAVSLICFSSSAILALVTNVPVLLYWYLTDVDIINNAVILFIYYFIGSSVPSGFVLWIMREMPHRQVVERPTESTVTLFRERPSTTQDPQWRTAVTSSNKALKSSPI